MNRRRPRLGFTLTEVLVGVVLLGVSSSFAIRMLLILTRSTNHMLQQTTLTNIEESIARSVMDRLVWMYRQQTSFQTHLSSGHCNLNLAFGNMPPAAFSPPGTSFYTMFNGTYGYQGLDYNLVSSNNQPPIIGNTNKAQNYGNTVASPYMAARQRCLTSQTQTLVGANGYFGDRANFYFCTTIQPPPALPPGNWSQNIAPGASAISAQTILAEFSFEIVHQVTGQPVDCSHFVNYAMQSLPNMNSPLVATLNFTLHTINRRVDVATTSTDLKNVTYRHVSSVLRMTPPLVWNGTPAISSLVMASPSVPYTINTGAMGARFPLPIVSDKWVLPIRQLRVCPWGTCNQDSSLDYTFNDPPPSGTVITGLYFGTNTYATAPFLVPTSYADRHHINDLAVPHDSPVEGKPNWSMWGGIPDCWNDIAGYCFGNIRFYQKRQSVGSLTSGTRVLQGIWMTPAGASTNISIDCTSPSLTNNVCCPKGMEYQGSLMDCSGASINPNTACAANRKINICATWLVWP